MPEPASPPPTKAPPAFGRTPVGVLVIIVVVALASVLATFSAVTPWYTQSGTIPQPSYVSTYTEEFTPGPGGLISTCSTFITSHLTECGTLGTVYNTGSGSALLSDLYLGLLGGAVSLAVLAFGGVVVLLSSASGKLRVRRAQFLLTILIVAALVVSTSALVAMPVLQGAALDDTGACAGFNATLTPCNSAFGHAAGVGCSDNSCMQTDLSWGPAIGWYLVIAAIALLVGALVVLRRHPIGAPCPGCGELNRFHGKFCDLCATPLPSRVPPRTYRLRL